METIFIENTHPYY